MSNDLGSGNATQLRDSQYRTDSNLSARIRLHSEASTSTIPWHDWLIEQIVTDGGVRGNVLEVGCGNGALWKRYDRDACADAVQLTLTDNSIGMVQSCRSGTSDLPWEIRYACVDIQRLPFPGDSFDSALALHMMYHVPDVHAALTELARVLTSTGRLYVTTNGLAHMRKLDEIGAIAAGVEISPIQFGSFDIDSAFPLLRAHFARVQYIQFVDSIETSDSALLFEYLNTYPQIKAVSESRRRELRQYLNDLVERAPVVIQKDSGLFICAQPRENGYDRGQS